MTHTPRIERAIRSVGRRVRVQRFLDGAAWAGLFALVGTILAVLFERLDQWPSSTAFAVGAFAAALVPLVGVIAAARPVSRLEAACALDASHALKSRLGSAVEFSSVPPEQRTAFMEAAIVDAEGLAEKLSPSRALRFRVPRPTTWLAPIALVLAVLVVWNPAPASPPPLLAPEPLAALVHPDDLDALRTAPPGENDEAPEVREVRSLASEFNRLLEKLADRALERTDALREVSALERRIEEARAVDPAGMQERLKALGKDLARAGIVRAASDALKEADADGAAEALRAAAGNVRDQNVSRAELERLREALERASERAAEEDRSTETLDARREALRRQIEKARAENDESESERRLLRRREDDLARVERDRERMDARRRQLERLSREWRDAAQRLRERATRESADALERSAEDLNRIARDAKSEEERRELARRIEQLRELLRRNAGRPGDDARNERLERFVRRAGGGNEGPAGEGPETRETSEARANGPPGSPSAPMGSMPTPGGSAEPLAGSSSGERPGEAGDDGEGVEAGQGHDRRRLDRETSLEGSTQDLRAATASGRGPSRSEVILGAADRGFVARPYQAVYRDYRDHAEEVLERDQIPDGYRFYVRRYFQLIRPREEP